MEVDTTVVNEMLSKTYDYHVLVVEDDPDVRYSLRKELSANFQVEVAGNGNEALDLLGQGDAFHLILSDVLMPGMNGFQLVNRVKNDLAFSHIPIILLTALSEDSQRIYGIAEGGRRVYSQTFQHRLPENTYHQHDFGTAEDEGSLYEESPGRYDGQCGGMQTDEGRRVVQGQAAEYCRHAI